jgi:hypothetical protein
MRRNASPANAPDLPADPIVGAVAGLRFHQVVDDRCTPAVCPRNYVLIAPIDNYVGEGFYLVQDPFATPMIYYCSALTKAGVRLGCLNRLYTSHKVSPDAFREIVLGKVAMTCKMQDASFLPWGA